jgi:predicted HAD superfamily phosphohydrolase YqeG
MLRRWADTDLETLFNTYSSVVVDVEPYLSRWGGSDAELSTAVSDLAEQASVHGVECVVVTNSSRRPTAVPDHIRYISNARKPWRTQGLPRGPHAVVLGDVGWTDGLLAWRLGADFVLVDTDEAPWWPRFQRWTSRPMLRVFFRARGVASD